MLRFENFGSSGSLANQVFEVVVPELGLAVTVPPDTSAPDALDRAGCEVMSDCLRGECGLCVLPVWVPHGVPDHRDVFLSGRQKSRNDRTESQVVVVGAGPVGMTAAALLTEATVRLSERLGRVVMSTNARFARRRDAYLSASLRDAEVRAFYE